MHKKPNTNTKRWPLITFPPINLWSLPHTFKYSYNNHEFTK